MAASESHLHPRVIVVGDRHNGFVKEMVCLAGEYELAVTPCDDVYSAVTELARHPDRSLLVIGQFRQLMRGKGDFLALAQRHGTHCCCLLDEESGMERDKILTAVRLGVRLAGEMADIREFLTGRLAAEGPRGPETNEEDLFREELRATEDELKALLRQETDG